MVGTAAYLGLVSLSRGGWSAFCVHPTRTALAVVLVVLAGVVTAADGNRRSELREIVATAGSPAGVLDSRR